MKHRAVSALSHDDYSIWCQEQAIPGWAPGVTTAVCWVLVVSQDDGLWTHDMDWCQSPRTSRLCLEERGIPHMKPNFMPETMHENIYVCMHPSTLQVAALQRIDKGTIPVVRVPNGFFLDYVDKLQHQGCYFLCQAFGAQLRT